MTEFKEARQALGWSQSRLAKEFGIPKRTYESWEMGDRNPPEYVKKLIIEKLKRMGEQMIKQEDVLDYINHAGADELMELQTVIIECLRPKGALRGFKELLDEYGVKDPLRETKLKLAISELEQNGVKVNQFTFERFKQEKHDDVKADLIEMLDSTIQNLETALENVKTGNAPTIE